MTPQTPTGKRLLSLLTSINLTNERLSGPDIVLIKNDILAIESETREGYVPASLSPEWHAELSMSFDEGRAEGAKSERERLRAEIRALWNSDAVFASTRELWEAFFVLLAEPEETP